MAKHSTKSKSIQDLHVAHTAHVELPLPMLSALEGIDRAFFSVCIEAGKQSARRDDGARPDGPVRSALEAR